MLAVLAVLAAGRLLAASTHSACGSTITAASAVDGFHASAESQCVGDGPGASGSGGGAAAGSQISVAACAVGGDQTCSDDQRTCTNGTPMVNIWFVPSGGGRPVYVGNNCPPGAVPQPTPGPTPADITRAFREIHLPPSTLTIEPPDSATLVNLATNFYTRAEPFQRTLTLLGHQVRFRITPHHYTWHFGDRTDTTTTTPGAPYPDLQVTHRYRTKGTATPSVDTTWQADYQLDDRPWTPLDATVTITGPPQHLTIKTATPILTG